MRAKSLSQVGMTVSDLRRSVDFYWGNFGIPVVEVIVKPSAVIRHVYGPADPTVKMAVLRCGWGSFIELFEFTPPKDGRGAKPPGHALTHLTLDVGNIDKTYERLTAAGVKFLGPPVHEQGAHFVFLRDPDGHLVELIDMGIIYYLNRFLGKFVGWFMMATRFRNRDAL